MMDTPLFIFCYQRSTSHPLLPPSVTSSLLCFTLVLIYFIPPQNLNMIFQVKLHQRGDGSAFSWTSLFKSPHQALYALVTLHVQSLIKSSCCVKLILYHQVNSSLCSFVHTGTTFLLTSKTLPHKPKMYLQDKPSIKEATSIHLTKVYKSLSHGAEDTSASDQVLSINRQMNAMSLTPVPCPITSTFYPGSNPT